MKKILLAAMITLGSIYAMAQDKAVQQRTINVTGIAEMEIVPDEIYVRVDLKEYDKKGSGKIDIETIRNRFLEACKSIGLTDKDISIQGYSGYDSNNIWDIKKKKKENPDLKAGITYEIKLSSTSKMNELVNKLDDEATQSFSISRVSHSKLDEYKKDLKIKAIKAAKEKATYLAEAIDEKVGQAITINDAEEINNYPRPMYANMVMKSADAAGGDAMNVDFKKMKLQFQVNVVFALK